MDIIIKSGAWSIDQITWPDVPRFAVVTGPNGAGKSQLLQVIQASVSGVIHNRRSQTSSPRVEFVGETIARGESILQVGWGSNFGMNTEEVLKLSTALRDLFDQARLGNKQHNRLREAIESRTSKPFNDITYEDFVAAVPEEYSFYSEQLNLGFTGFSKAVALYKMKLVESKLNAVPSSPLASAIGKAPWETMNELFAAAEFPYEVTVSNTLSVFSSHEAPRLIDRRSGVDVHPTDLSSGEKVILGLCLLLYKSNFEGVLPKVVLLDEPDSHLHPRMIKRMVDVIAEVLVARLNIRVIMTTHSPTTVAFVPEESLFAMKREHPRIQKCTRSEAMSELTAGLLLVGPHIKQTFVEGDEDVNFYRMIVDVLLAIDGPAKLPLSFMPVKRTDKASGGREQVIEWTTKLRNAVDERFVGIVDGDGPDVQEPKLPGIVATERYSIENYLLDPLIILTVWMDMNDATIVQGLTVGDESDFRRIPHARLQQIVDKVLSELKVPLSGLDWSTVEVAYSNGVVLTYPKWLITHRGKDLLEKIQQVRGGPTHINYKRLSLAYFRVRMVPQELKDRLIKLSKS